MSITSFDILDKYVPLYFRHPRNSEERRIVLRLVTEQLQILFPMVNWNINSVRHYFYYHFLSYGNRKVSSEYFREVDIIPFVCGEPLHSGIPITHNIRYIDSNHHILQQLTPESTLIKHMTTLSI